MTEMTWTAMTIGGELPESKVKELENIIDGEFSYLAAYTIKSGETVDIAGFVNYGNPDDVKQFCADNNLTYWHHFDAGYEWDAGVTFWKPGMESEIECGASGQGSEPLLTLHELRKHAAEGRTLEMVIERLTKYESGNVPPLTIKAEA